MSLTKIINSAKRLLLVGLLAAVTGCSMYFPMGKRKRLYNQVYFEYGARPGMEIARSEFNLSKERQTIPIHPDDGDPSQGSVAVKGFDEDYFRLNIGLEGSIIIADYLRLKTGGDIKFGFGGEDDKMKLQPLPPPYQSYGGITFSRHCLTSVPFIGLSINLGDKLKCDVEVGCPYTRYSVKRWHHRYNSKEPIDKYSWQGFGESLNVNLGYKFDNVSFGLGYGIEKYRGKGAKMKTENIHGWLFHWKF